MAKESAPEIPVRSYRTQAGTEPVLEWLRGLDRADRRGDWSELDASAIRLAHRNASSTKSEGWALGSWVSPA